MTDIVVLAFKLIFGDISTLVFGPCRSHHVLLLNIIVGAKPVSAKLNSCSHEGCVQGTQQKQEKLYADGKMDFPTRQFPLVLQRRLFKLRLYSVCIRIFVAVHRGNGRNRDNIHRSGFRLSDGLRPVASKTNTDDELWKHLCRPQIFFLVRQQHLNRQDNACTEATQLCVHTLQGATAAGSAYSKHGSRRPETRWDRKTLAANQETSETPGHVCVSAAKPTGQPCDCKAGLRVRHPS